VKTIMKYAAVAVVLGALSVPVLAADLKLPDVTPSVPPLTGQKVIQLITTIVQDVLAVAVVIAIGYFVYGGIRFAMGEAKDGKDKMLNAAIGIAAILGVGLVVSTISSILKTQSIG
jgi:hypothetical protein